MTGPARRLRDWRPRTPQLSDDPARLVTPDDPDWFAPERAIAAAPSWWVWTFLLRHFSWLGGIFGRMRATGELSDELRRGPLLLPANQIGDFDPFVIAVALHRLGVVPRIMATGGIVCAPVAGALLEPTGALRVERSADLVPSRRAHHRGRPRRGRPRRRLSRGLGGPGWDDIP